MAKYVTRTIRGLIVNYKVHEEGKLVNKQLHCETTDEKKAIKMVINENPYGAIIDSIERVKALMGMQTEFFIKNAVPMKNPTTPME